MRATTLKNPVIPLLTLTAMSLCGCSEATPGDGTPDEQNLGNETLVLLADTEAMLRTGDVYDVDNEIMHVGSASNSLVWTATGESFPAIRWPKI